MKHNNKTISAHYESAGLEKRILDAVTSAAEDGAVSRDLLGAFDEFHIGARRATQELARLCSLKPGWQVLDAGCGVGGPARTLAAEFGCRVTAFDLAGEYCRSARRLTQLAGLQNAARFCLADALHLPFQDSIFDAVFSQHVTMNIADKQSLFSGYRRVLRPDGRLALYEVCAGPLKPPHFPLPWAESEAISFLVSPEKLRDLLAHTGFRELVWEDVSRPARTWLRKSVTRHQTVKQTTPRITPRLLMGNLAAAKASNVSRNLKENRIRVIRTILTLG